MGLFFFPLICFRLVPIMASLNELAEILAERAGRQLDTPFNEEMKVVLAYWLSRLRRDTLQQNKRDRMYFTQYSEVPLIEANITDFPGFPDTRVLVTTCQLPNPLRANGIMFDYVGSVDKLTSFGRVYTEMHELRAALDAKYTGSSPKILWVNNKLWVFNRLDLPAIGVRGIYDDPRILAEGGELCNCGCTSCYDDDQEYPCPRDVQQKAIQAVLGTELKEKGTQPSTIEVNADSQTQEPHRN